jgi:hypothetical protein
MQVHIFRGLGRDLNRGDVQTNFDVNECLEDIEKFGFHLTDGHVRITDQVTC